MKKAKVLEREISKDWIKDQLKSFPGNYAFRIHDCPWSSKNFDAFYFDENHGICWALEFKVDRRKVFRYNISELPAHQHKALLAFANGGNRRSKVLIYHVSTQMWYELEVSHAPSVS